MPYSELLIKPMREDLTKLGIRETRTPEAVDAAIANARGPIMVVVNSVCGCAAGRTRPGVALALQNDLRPQDMITVFAGADIEATERARDYFKVYAPCSPSIGLLSNGEPLFMLGGARLKEEMLLKLQSCSSKRSISTALRNRDNRPSATKAVPRRSHCHGQWRWINAAGRPPSVKVSTIFQLGQPRPNTTPRSPTPDRTRVIFT